MPTSLKPSQMLDAQGALHSVPKDAVNAFHKYPYTSAEQMIESCREALLAAGISISQTDATPMSIGGRDYVQLTFARICDGVTNVDTCHWPIVETKGCPFDKAWAGAITTGVNYYLRGLLLVPRCETEIDTRDDRNHVVAPKGKYSHEVMQLAKQVASKWPGDHSVNDVLTLYENRTGETSDDSAWEFMKTSLARLESNKEDTNGSE